MRMLALTTALLSLGFAPVPFPKPRSELKGDLHKLQGEWVLTGASYGRGDPVRPHSGGETFVFSRDRVSIRTKGVESIRWAVALEPSPVTPPRIDLHSPVNPRRPAIPNEFLIGVYRLEGDRLTLCFRNSTNALDRPTGYDPRAGWLVKVFERKKPG